MAKKQQKKVERKPPVKSKPSAQKGSSAKRRSLVKKKSSPRKKPSAVRSTAKKKTAIKAKTKTAARPSTKKSTGKSTGARKTAIKKGKTTQKRKTGTKITPARQKRKLQAAARKSVKVSQTHKPPVKSPFPAYKGGNPFMFTSYAHEDMKTVFRVIKKLNTSRYRIWYDEGIEPGNEWPEVVGKAIIKCSQFLVFMSSYAALSRNVRNEINLAFNENKEILVVFLDETQLTEGMKLQIGTVQFINKYEFTEKEFFNKLKKVINSRIRS